MQPRNLPSAMLLTLPLALSLGLAGPPSRLPAFHTAARAPVARPSVVVAEEYSQSSRLREEVEAPFAKVRLFVWPALMAGAAIATYFAGTSLLAEAVGAREPAPDSLVNLGVDLAAVAAIGTVWRRDLQARDSRLKRLSAGAAMAALRVELGGDATGVLPLADLRAGRKLPRRVVIVAAPEAVLADSLRAAEAASAALAAADMLVVPLAVADGGGVAAPAAGSVPGAGAAHLALPAGGGWNDVVGTELATAVAQNADAAARGFTLILKKNGRVGTRRLGLPDWPSLVGDVGARAGAGLDTRNI